MAKPCPSPMDVTDLQFKLQCRLKVFNNRDTSNFPNLNSLVTCASRYGLLFVGTSLNEFQVIQTNSLFKYNPKDKDVVSYVRRTVQLPSTPKHLIVNCDCTILAVVVEKDQCATVIFYETLSFLRETVKIIKELRLSATPNIFIREVNWNPSLPNIFTACKSDNSLGVYELKGDSVDINELPPAAGATCFCWSPKGKQLAVGSKDGKITQYKPDLKAVKAIAAPKLDGAATIISLQWVSNYQFIGVYQLIGNDSCCVIVVDAPKTGEPAYTNYDDICYSGSSRPHQFYMIFQQTWNFLMVASANSTEVGVLGNSGDSWIQWITLDTARAELPLSEDHQETFPVGVTFDISSTEHLPWGESTIPPCPLLCLLSHQGVLCVFNVVYLKEGLPSVCTPPDPISDLSGLSKFSVPLAPSITTPLKEPVVTTQAVTAAIQSTPLVSKDNSAEILSKGLFGEQATVTPIKPQQKASGLLPGTALFGGQTSILPVSKPQTQTPPSSLNEKYSSIFSSLNQAVPASASSAVPVKPIVVNAIPKQEVKPPVFQNKQEQSQDTPIKDQQNVSTPKRLDVGLINRLIIDERNSLNGEIAQLIKMGRSLQLNVGSDQEMVNLIEQIEALQEFVKDAVEISQGQSNEIHCLKQNLIQAWAWFEEAKSLYNDSKNEVVNLLIKVQSLDSLSEKRLKDIDQLAYYIESQITLADKVLDEQWGSFQDYTKKRYKQKVHTVDSIFQTMVNQNAVIQKQTYLLKTVSMRLKQKKSKINSLLISLEKDHDLVEDFQSLHLNPDDLLQLQVEKIKNHSKKLSATKIKKLQTLMKDRPVVQVKAVKPQISTWTFNQSPSNSKVKSCLDKLNASAARSLDFSQDESVAELEESRSTPPPMKTGLTSSQSSAFAPLTPTFKPQFQPQTVEFKTSAASSFVPQPAKDKDSFFTQTNATSSTTGFGLSTAGNLFGAKTSTQIQTVQVTNATTSINTNIAGKCLKLTEATGEPQSSTLGETINNVITVSLFGNKSEVTSSASAIPASATTFKNIFGGAASQFGTNTSSTTALPTNSGTIDLSKTSFGFGSSPSTAMNLKKESNSTSSSAVFPSSTPSVSTGFSSAIFNASKTGSAVASSAPSFFGSNNSSGSVVLGSASNSASTGSNMFGSSTTTGSVVASSAPSFFGSNKSPGSLVLGNTSNSTSTGSPLSTTTSSASSFFGNKSSGTLVPGSASNSTFAGSNLFGSPKSTTTNPPVGVGRPIFTTPTTTSSTFGSPISATTVTSNVTAPKVDGGFGSPIVTKPATSAVTNTTATVTSIPPVATGNDKPSDSSSQPLPETPKTTAPSIFSSVASISASSSVEAASSTTASNLFGAAKPTVSIFGSSTSVSGNQGNIFAAKPQQSLFGTTSAFGTTSVPNSSKSESTTAEPIFGAASSPPSSIVSGATPTSENIFAAKPISSQAQATFAPKSEAVVASTAPAFGSDATKKEDSSNKESTVPVTTSSNVFGAQSFPSSTPSTTPLFGTSTTSSTFGNAPFGSASSSTFGSPSSSSSGSFFGSSTVSSTTSIFGSGATSGSSIFGAPTTTSSTFTPAFGATSSSTSPFGATPAVTTATPAFGAFGSSATTPAPSNNIFGAPSTASGSTFGSVFATTTTAGATSPFGPPSAPAAQQSTTGSFGFGGLSMGASGAASSGSIFGGTSGSTFGQQANPFGKVESKPAFGSTATNIFGSPSTATTSSGGSIFGSTSTATPAGSTFGSSSPFGAAPAFGQSPAFGQTSAFNQSSFGSPQSQAGPFSAAAATPVAQTGFGSPATFQKPGFGSAPVFGSSGFGSPPSFGTAPSFGAAPVFGSPQKVFGSSGPAATTGGFGAAAAQPSTGFGNLASQNTIGFGNLAQQANSGSASMPFSGSSSFTSWR